MAKNAEISLHKFTEHQTDIQYLKTVIKEGNFTNKENQDKIAREIEDRLTKKMAKNARGNRAEDFERERKYLLSRRSLRLWPIMGTKDNELWASTGEFIHNILMVPGDEVGEEDIEYVRRTSNKTRGRVKYEACLLYTSPSPRDS